MTFQEKYKQLCQFKSSVDLADFLLKQGIKGKRGDNCRCPIARYLGPGTIVGCSLIKPYNDRDTEKISSDTRLPSQCITSFMLSTKECSQNWWNHERLETLVG